MTAAPTPVIATEALTKFYGRHRGIEDVTFAVERGEVFGFLGPNGAGKTNTLRTLLDFLRPTRGRAAVFAPSATPSTRSGEPRPSTTTTPPTRSGTGRTLSTWRSWPS